MAPRCSPPCWRLAAEVGALTADWHGFNVLHTAAARVGALDLGFVPGPNGKSLAHMLDGGVDVLWLLGADEFDTARIGADTFVIYQGHHGDAGARRADVILPGAAYTEKPGTYVNTEGRVQRGFLRGLSAGRGARGLEDHPRASATSIGHTLPYDTIEALRARLEQVNPVFGQRRLPAALRLHRPVRPGRRSRRAGRRAVRARRSPTTTRPIRSAAPARPWRPAPPASPAPRSRRRNSRRCTQFFY